MQRDNGAVCVDDVRFELVDFLGKREGIVRGRPARPVGDMAELD